MFVAYLHPWFSKSKFGGGWGTLEGSRLLQPQALHGLEGALDGSAAGVRWRAKAAAAVDGDGEGDGLQAQHPGVAAHVRRRRPLRRIYPQQRLQQHLHGSHDMLLGIENGNMMSNAS